MICSFRDSDPWTAPWVHWLYPASPWPDLLTQLMVKQRFSKRNVGSNCKPSLKQVQNLSLAAGCLLNVCASLTLESPSQAPKCLCQNLLLFYGGGEVQQLWALTPQFSQSLLSPGAAFALVTAPLSCPFPPNGHPSSTSVTHLMVFWGQASNRHN